MTSANRRLIANAASRRGNVGGNSDWVVGMSFGYVALTTVCYSRRRVEHCFGRLRDGSAHVRLHKFGFLPELTSAELAQLNAMLAEHDARREANRQQREAKRQQKLSTTQETAE